MNDTKHKMQIFIWQLLGVLAICCYKQDSTIIVGLIFTVGCVKKNYSKLPLTGMYGEWGVLVTLIWNSCRYPMFFL
jgi:hypothetical protein